MEFETRDPVEIHQSHVYDHLYKKKREEYSIVLERGRDEESGTKGEKKVKGEKGIEKGNPCKRREWKLVTTTFFTERHVKRRIGQKRWCITSAFCHALRVSHFIFFVLLSIPKTFALH